MEIIVLRIKKWSFTKDGRFMEGCRLTFAPTGSVEDGQQAWGFKVMDSKTMPLAAAAQFANVKPPAVAECELIPGLGFDGKPEFDLIELRNVRGYDGAQLRAVKTG